MYEQDFRRGDSHAGRVLAPVRRRAWIRWCQNGREQQQPGEEEYKAQDVAGHDTPHSIPQHKRRQQNDRRQKNGLILEEDRQHQRIYSIRRPARTQVSDACQRQPQRQYREKRDINIRNPEPTDGHINWCDGPQCRRQQTCGRPGQVITEERQYDEQPHACRDGYQPHHPEDGGWRCDRIMEIAGEKIVDSNYPRCIGIVIQRTGRPQINNHARSEIVVGFIRVVNVRQAEIVTCIAQAGPRQQDKQQQQPPAATWPQGQWRNPARVRCLVHPLNHSVSCRPYSPMRLTAKRASCRYSTSSTR